MEQADRAERPTERITIGFTPQAADQLRELVVTTGLTKTDLANRSVSLYAFVTGEIQAGRTLLSRDDATGHVERIHLL